LGFVARGQDGQHGAERLAVGVAQRSAWSTAAGISAASRTSMRWPALWPSGTDLSAACIMFSAQPKAKASKVSRTVAGVADAARAKATG
jgi:hypothetical protein